SSFDQSYTQLNHIEEARWWIPVLEQESTQAQFMIDAQEKLVAKMPNTNNIDKANRRREQGILDAWRQEEKQRQLNLTQQRRSVPGPAEPQQIKEDVERYRRTCNATLSVLRRVVDAARAKYQELEKDDDVTSALAKQRRTTKVHFKLGPSDEFKAADSWLK